jgi:hypothetical protein
MTIDATIEWTREADPSRARRLAALLFASPIHGRPDDVEPEASPQDPPMSRAASPNDRDALHDTDASEEEL